MAPPPSTPGTRRPQPKHGFTLLELILVIAILSLVTGLVIPNVTRLEDDAAQTVTQSTLHALRTALCGTPEAPGLLDDVRLTAGFDPATLRIAHLLSTNGTGFVTFDPLTGQGWRGPYVRTANIVRNTSPERSGLYPAPGDRRWDGDATFEVRRFYGEGGSEWYGEAGDRAVADAWGNPIVLQVPPSEAFADAAQRFDYARLVSAGPDGILQTPCFGAGSLTEEGKSRLRLAGRLADGPVTERGDDLVLFLSRADAYEQGIL